jgi:hypothetical protein
MEAVCTAAFKIKRQARQDVGLVRAGDNRRVARGLGRADRRWSGTGARQAARNVNVVTCKLHVEVRLTHLRDLIEVGLIRSAPLENLDPVLRDRLATLMSTPGG